VVRTASRLATGLNASFRRGERAAGRARGERSAKASASRTRCASRRLGGETERLIGQDLPAEILQYAAIDL